jgi:hypothetical protein
MEHASCQLHDCAGYKALMQALHLILIVLMLDNWNTLPYLEQATQSNTLTW